MAIASSRPARPAPLWLVAFLLAFIVLPVCPLPVAAQGLGAADAAGSWDLTFEKGNRRCRLTLRPATSAGNAPLAMPAGCHRAFPLLAGVTNWSAADNDHVTFLTPDGATVFDFAARGGPGLVATIGEDADTYMLTPVDPALRDRLRATASDVAPVSPQVPVLAPQAPLAPGDGVLVGTATPLTTAALPAQAMLPPVTAAEVAGNYAVLRDSRDTGCMVVLEDGAGRADARAKLAPACRDQGIVVFDPVGWALAKGDLILTAKRGHKTALNRRADRNWATAPARGPALVLKRL